MKALGAAVLALLCSTALCSYQGEKTYVPSTCCLSYTPRPIPRKRVVSYFKTSGQCSKLGVVFLTKKGLRICANPEDAWVQDYISNMKETPLGGPASQRANG